MYTVLLQKKRCFYLTTLYLIHLLFKAKLEQNYTGIEWARYQLYNTIFLIPHTYINSKLQNCLFLLSDISFQFLWWLEYSISLWCFSFGFSCLCDLSLSIFQKLWRCRTNPVLPLRNPQRLFPEEIKFWCRYLPSIFMYLWCLGWPIKTSWSLPANLLVKIWLTTLLSVHLLLFITFLVCCSLVLYVVKTALLWPHGRKEKYWF